MKNFFYTIRNDIGSLPRPVFVLVFGQFINRCGAFVYPFLSLYLIDQGFQFERVSGVLAVIATGSMFGPIAGGYFADAFGRRNTIVFSLLSTSVSLIAVYMSSEYVTLLGASFVYGFSSYLFGPPSNALIADLVKPEMRITAYTLMRLAINSGFAVGPMVAGLLYSKSPMFIFVGDAATTSVFAVFAFVMLPHGLKTVKGRVTSPRVAFDSWKVALKDVWHNREYCQFLLAVLLMGIGFGQVFSLLALSTRGAGLNASAYGIIMGFNGALIVLLEIPLIQYVKRFDSRKVIGIGYALIAVSCVLFGVVDSTLGFFGVMALFTLGEIVGLPIGMAYSSNLAPEEFRGRYFGIRGMVWALSGLVGSLGVWAYGVCGDAWWYFSGIVVLAGSIVIAQKIGQKNRETELAVAENV